VAGQDASAARDAAQEAEGGGDRDELQAQAALNLSARERERGLVIGASVTSGVAALGFGVTLGVGIRERRLVLSHGPWDPASALLW
jgi:hypothetical protein